MEVVQVKHLAILCDLVYKKIAESNGIVSALYGAGWRLVVVRGVEKRW